jgi:hypothetical protein
MARPRASLEASFASPERANWNREKWTRAWRDFSRKFSRKCESCGGNSSRVWNRLRGRWKGVRLAGHWYCRSECLATGLRELLRKENPAAHSEAAPAHRIPLGLLLLSRQQLTAEQLRSALAAQRAAGQGRIGEWLQRLGFASEGQVVAALARQWSCPILRSPLAPASAQRWAPIPLLLLETFRMIPAGFSDATGTLLMAFSEGVDHSVLYSIGQMLECRTQACVASASALQMALEELGQRKGSGDVVFDRMEDAGECARIVGSYTTKMQAEEVRLARCGTHLWIRLEGPRRPAVNMVLRTPVEIAATPREPESPAFFSAV